jgi:hypothetical protein
MSAFKTQSKFQNTASLLIKIQIMINFNFKVLSLLGACFDLISSPSLSMKIQIMGGKITENLGFKTPLRKVKMFLFIFLSIFKFFTQNCVSLVLATF